MKPKHHIESNLSDPVMVSLVAYLSLIGWLVSYYFLNNHRHHLSDFHLRQALGVNLLFILSSILISLPLFGYFMGIASYVFSIIIWIVGMSAAIHAEEKKVPFLGTRFQKWFRPIGK